ncbi:MAG TPA: hypothetical protein VFD12_06930 [Oligella sp.]|nr:hypothetical protein [Oligella sp.]
MRNDRPVIDLTKYHARRESKGLVLFSTWWWNGEEGQYEPGLVLVTARGLQGKEKTVPCLIPLSSAYAYHDEQNGHRHLLAMSKLFNEQMGGADTLTEVHNVADLIHGSLLDLIAMPPRPTELERVVADAVATDQNGKQIHAEIRE